MKYGLWKCAAASLVTTLALGAQLAAAKDLTLAEVQPDGHILVKSEEVFASRLAESTHGDLKINLKPNAQLGNETQAWQKVRTGAIDIVRINVGATVGEIESAKFMSLPYLFHSRDHMWSVLNGDFGKRAASEYEKAGAVVLAYYDSGTRSFYTTKKPIRNRSDFAGMRIRVQNSPIYKDLITELGGTPVVIDYDKVTDALKNGQIDAAENNLPSYVSSEHYKYARYYNLDEHSSVPEVLLMSKKTWDSLSPAQRKDVMNAATESAVFMKKQWADSEVQAMAKARKEGATIVDKRQINMTGIEEFAVRLYTKYITNTQDLNTILNIMRTK